MSALSTSGPPSSAAEKSTSGGAKKERKLPKPPSPPAPSSAAASPPPAAASPLQPPQAAPAFSPTADAAAPQKKPPRRRNKKKKQGGGTTGAGGQPSWAFAGGQRSRKRDSYGIVLWVPSAPGSPPAAAHADADGGAAANITQARANSASTQWWFVLQESVSQAAGDLKLDPLRGKLEGAESPAEAAARETYEESMACLDIDPASLGDLFDRQNLFHVRASLEDKGEAAHGSSSSGSGSGTTAVIGAATGKPPLVEQLEAAFAHNRALLARDPALCTTLGIEVKETLALRGLCWSEIVSFALPTRVEVADGAADGRPRLAKQVVNMLKDQGLAWSRESRPAAAGALPIDLSCLPEIRLRPTTTPHGLQTLGNRPGGTGRGLMRRAGPTRRGYFRELSTIASIQPTIKLPTAKLETQVKEGAEPVVLVSLGSFSPPTVMHLRLMEDARDKLNDDPRKQVVGGYLCPTHHKYGKASLAPMHHRINMLGLAIESSPWIDVDMWECAQDEWTPTALSLDRISEELAKVPVAVGNDEPRPGLIKVMMVCGADLLGTFTTMKEDGQPLWLPEHREIILAQNGIACLRREGTDLESLIEETELLRKNRENIVIVDAAATNVVSSTVVRRQLAMNKSIRYLVPDAVEDYIRRHSLHLLPNWQLP